ncbi:MAG TPA: type III-B CRISPR module-associated protein Cmr5 [Ktedonobacteraceae bacterium]|nr:type III-B CRISPR module-associated protein Cmr5 [Ktedonobacteraceae bacterium]
MLTRDQEYAISAHKCVTQINKDYEKDEQSKRRYGSTAHKLPILIRTAGLAQALAFVETRGKGDDNPYRYFLRDLKTTIGKDEQASLCEYACAAELDEYMLLTQQVLHALVWYKRFAQSILDVDASARIDEGEE